MNSPRPKADSKLSAPIDIRRVRDSFSEPERTRESDFLRREIAQRMAERLALVKLTPQAVLDAGCGEGADLVSLQKRYADARMMGVDAAPAMLAAARKQQGSAWSALNNVLAQWLPNRLRAGKMLGAQPGLLCGDFAQLPLAANAVDLVWSNMALHWHPQPDRVFAEWRRVLRVDGLLMFSCFGPDTMKELRTALGQVDRAPHVLPFVDMHDFGDMLGEAGFATPVMDMETITITYETTAKLLADVRALGGNPLANRRRGLIGRSAWGRALQILENSRRADGRIPLSFEIIYGHAFRPQARTNSRGESIVHFDWPKK